MELQQVCVLHLAGDTNAQTFEQTVRAVGQLGLQQALLPLRSGPLGRAAQALEVRAVQWPRGLRARIGALAEELAAQFRERSIYALHLHGPRACLFGARALRASRLHGRIPAHTRVLFSPQLGELAPWKSALAERLLRAELAPLDWGVLLASSGEAHLTSRLFERSAEVLPPTVDAVFLQSARHEAGRPSVFAGGDGWEAVGGVSRLAVLLNGREERVPMSWIGPTSTIERAQLEAAGVRVFDAPDAAAQARLLSTAAAYLHISQAAAPLQALAQAMAAGVPCLASDTLAHRAILRHGETGYLCAGELDFVEKLILLLRDPAERERLGQAARAEAARSFTQRQFQSAVLRAYGFHRVTLLPMKSVNVA